LIRLFALAAILLLLACRGQGPPLVLATTTSVVNSGLLDRVLPAYSTQTVRTIPSGSGRALAMLASGHCDVIISHAPARETEALRNHPTWFYRKILYNDFLIVGPSNDPASIAGMADAAQAMTRIIQSGQRFLSRGDESGTHEREQQLWSTAGIDQRHAQIIVAGAGMGQTLRVANATNGYTLTDRGTWETLSPSLQLRILVTGDPRLLNTYAVIADSQNERGSRFARWLAEGDGRRVLAGVLSSGTVKGFAVWPADRDGGRPDARPF